MKLFGKGGLKKLAQPQIAKAAQVPQGHITYYFPTRSDLLLAVAEKSVEAIGEQFLSEVSKSKSEVSSDRMIPMIAKLLKDDTRTRMLVGLLVESDSNPHLRRKLQESLNFSFRLIATAIAKVPNSPEVAVIHAALMGLALQQYLAGPKVDQASMDDSLQCLSLLGGTV